MGPEKRGSQCELASDGPKTPARSVLTDKGRGMKAADARPVGGAGEAYRMVQRFDRGGPRLRVVADSGGLTHFR